MFNLLPDNLKKKIKKQYNLRRVIIVLLFFIFIQISFMIFLLPTWLMSSYKEEDVNLRGIDLNNYLASLNIASTTENIKSLNSQLSVMDKALSYPEIVMYIDGVLSKRTNSIHIDNVSYTGSDSKNAILTIDGTSATRESLVSFVKNLQSSGMFKSVDLPISNFANDKDLAFSIKITISES